MDVKRVLGLICVACGWPILVSLPLPAVAAPNDIDSLIDDRGRCPCVSAV